MKKLILGTMTAATALVLIIATSGNAQASGAFSSSQNNQSVNQSASLAPINLSQVDAGPSGCKYKAAEELYGKPKADQMLEAYLNSKNAVH